MAHERIAKLDQALARLAEERRHVEKIIERQQARLAANAELIEQARRLLSRHDARR